LPDIFLVQNNGVEWIIKFKERKSISKLDVGWFD
jgi:hypothetical protein